MFAQWDDHEVTNDWWPGEAFASGDYQREKTHASTAARRAASRAFHEFMPMREAPAEAGRIYRKISYGPLLDVFMLDMRSYRGLNGDAQETATVRLRSSRRRATCLAQARADAIRARPGR